MKTLFLFHLALTVIAAANSAAGATRYVNANNPVPVAPFTNWATASIVIQDAIDVAEPGDEILVTNGVYGTGGRAVFPGMTNRVAVTKPITLRSVNGPEVTVIRGHQVPGTTNGDGAVRCVYLASGATLIGFTLTNGAVSLLEISDHQFVSGGGVWCEAPGASVSNCVLSGNSAVYGGGAFWGTLDSCQLSANIATRAGGGAARAKLNRCVLMNNSAGRKGGGAYNASVNYCTIAGNTAASGGGVSRCALNSCYVSANAATEVGPGTGMGGGAHTTSLTNCLVWGNIAQKGGGAWRSSLVNCTVASNAAGLEGGGVWSLAWRWRYDPSSTEPPPFDGCLGLGCVGPYPECTGLLCDAGYQSLVLNCIIYDNTAPIGANHSGFTGSAVASDGYQDRGTLDYSCTTPMPTNGVGNITNAPLFMDASAGDFRLQSSSPCINAGRNAYAPAGSDLDGKPRIAGATVDMGAYEFQSPQSGLSYAWLQQYGLPTDGSADFGDLDGDGHSNHHEWRAWTDPKDPTSTLSLLVPLVSTNGVRLRWPSVGGLTYFLERSTNVGSGLGFIPMADDIPGQSGSTTYTDTNTDGSGPFFYRLGVRD